jgi:hypothetical protein
MYFPKQTLIKEEGNCGLSDEDESNAEVQDLRQAYCETILRCQ